MTPRSCRKFWPRCFLAPTANPAASRERWPAHAARRARRVARERVQASIAANRLDGSARAAAGEVERGAVVDRDARIGQAERQVDRAARSRCT